MQKLMMSASGSLARCCLLVNRFYRTYSGTGVCAGRPSVARQPDLALGANLETTNDAKLARATNRMSLSVGQVMEGDSIGGIRKDC